jgi:hypothetical protein
VVLDTTLQLLGHFKVVMSLKQHACDDDNFLEDENEWLLLRNAYTHRGL